MRKDNQDLQAELDLFFNIPAVRLAARLALVTQREVLQPFDLKVMEWRTLVHLYRFDHLHLREIARQVSTDASHASRVLAGMEKRGIVTRSADETDARRIVFSLTDSGAALFEQVWPLARNISDQFRNQFTPEDYAMFLKMIGTATAFANQRLDWPQDQ